MRQSAGVNSLKTHSSNTGENLSNILKERGTVTQDTTVMLTVNSLAAQPIHISSPNMSSDVAE